MLYIDPTYGISAAVRPRPRAQEGQRGAPGPVAGRGAAAPRLRDREAHRDAVEGRAALPRGVPLPGPLPHGAPGMDPGALGGEGGPAAAAVLPDQRRGPARA